MLRLHCHVAGYDIIAEARVSFPFIRVIRCICTHNKVHHSRSLSSSLPAASIPTLRGAPRARDLTFLDTFTYKRSASNWKDRSSGCLYAYSLTYAYPRLRYICIFLSEMICVLLKCKRRISAGTCRNTSPLTGQSLPPGACSKGRRMVPDSNDLSLSHSMSFSCLPGLVCARSLRL